MNLYRLSQDDETGYDTYSDCVVAAVDEEAARHIRPDGGTEWASMFGGTWARYPNLVKVELIGTAVEGTVSGVICASFHAG